MFSRSLSAWVQRSNSTLLLIRLLRMVAKFSIVALDIDMATYDHV